MHATGQRTHAHTPMPSGGGLLDPRHHGLTRGSPDPSAGRMPRTLDQCRCCGASSSQKAHELGVASERETPGGMTQGEVTPAATGRLHVRYRVLE